MGSNNRGRSTTGGPAVPYYPRSPRIEAAMTLRLLLSRYINDRASIKEVGRAWDTFLEAAADEKAAKAATEPPSDELGRF